METWNPQSPRATIKFETSPADSFLSAPSEMYSPLFDASEIGTMNPLEIVTPESFSEDRKSEMSETPGAATASRSGSCSPDPATAASEKKPTKKRKSWGQVLPEPKTCLPPRKRAKTEDEKEQRRVERVLRNRRAAQSSRERKRQEVEHLERRNKELEEALHQSQQTNLALMEALQKFQRNSGVASPLRPTGVTFSQELFSSQDGHSTVLERADSLDELLKSVPSSNTTVNPASLSPALTPIPENEDEDEDEDEPVTAATPLAKAAATSEDASPDATQHPAAMLWQDLQCRSAEVPPPSWFTASQQPLHPALALLLPLQVLLASSSTLLYLCQRPLMQIAMSLKAGFSLPPTPLILNTIISLVTTPSPSPSRPRARPSPTTSTSTTSSSTSSAPLSHLPSASSSSSRSSSSNSSSNNSDSNSIPTAPRSPSRRSSTTLRLKFLRKILTCSPSLARPLSDATMEVLRLVSTEGQDVTEVLDGAGSSAGVVSGGMQLQSLTSQQRPQRQQQQRLESGNGQHKTNTWMDGKEPPSKEVLLTLLWAIKVEERRMQIRQQRNNPSSELGGRSGIDQPLPSRSHTNKSQMFVLKVLSPKRKLEEESAQHYCSSDIVDSKRRRLG